MHMWKNIFSIDVRSAAIRQLSIHCTKLYVEKVSCFCLWWRTCSSHHKTLNLEPSLCCSSPALCITLAGWPVQPSWWWFRGTHSCAGVGLEGTCSGTWIRLVHHPVLPASRLLSRVPEMGCQGHRASCLSCCFFPWSWRGIGKLLCLF